MKYGSLFLLLSLGAAPCLAETPPTPSQDAGYQATFGRLLEFIGGKTADFQSSFNSSSRTRTVKGSVHFVLQQPNLFRIDAQTGKAAYTLVSDGQVMTIYGPETNKYVELRAPESASGGLALITGLSSSQSQLLRMVSVLREASQGSDRFAVTTGETGKVGDHECQRFMIEEKTDERYSENWDVWLQTGDVPLPCKFSVRTSDGSTDDVQTNSFSWKAPAISGETFVFVPPKGSRKVDSVSEVGFSPDL
jgi:hypothetical protein